MMIKVLEKFPAVPFAVTQPTPVQPPGLGGVQTVMNWAMWGLTIACVLGFVISAVMMAIRHQRQEPGESMGRVGWVCLACLIGSAAAPMVNALIAAPG